MFVCPTVSRLHFYGCCHPCSTIKEVLHYKIQLHLIFILHGSLRKGSYLYLTSSSLVSVSLSFIHNSFGRTPFLASDSGAPDFLLDPFFCLSRGCAAGPSGSWLETAPSSLEVARTKALAATFSV